jgi:hypothetical protein
MRATAPQDHADAHMPAWLRIGLTALVALAEAVHLAFEHVNGGIVSHHLLNDPGLPAIWNGWGLLVLPLIAWIASARAFERSASGWRMRSAFVLPLVAALLAGAALSTAFSLGREDVAGAVLVGLLLSALAVRVYRAPYLLGFVLGMALTFGALLPTFIGGAIALLSAAVWLGLWPLLGRAMTRVRA